MSSASQLNARDMASCELVRGGAIQRSVPAGAAAMVAAMCSGRFKVEHWRDGQRIDEYQFNNGITNQGKNTLLGIMFHSVTQITEWHLGAISSSGYSQLQAGDTYVNIGQVANQWTEFTSYTDANNADSSVTRPTWTTDAASAQSITNSTLAILNITGSGTVKGLFVVGGITNAKNKSDHASGGILWATALFGTGDVTVVNGDQLKVTYAVSA